MLEASNTVTWAAFCVLESDHSVCSAAVPTSRTMAASIRLFGRVIGEQFVKASLLIYFITLKGDFSNEVVFIIQCPGASLLAEWEG